MGLELGVGVELNAQEELLLAFEEQTTEGVYIPSSYQVRLPLSDDHRASNLEQTEQSTNGKEAGGLPQYPHLSRHPVATRP
jgi:hypothetical protein